MFNKILAAVIFGILILQAQLVLAQTETNNTTQTATQKTMEQRIADRKAALKTKLDAAVQTRIKAKCVASQKLVNAAKTRSDKAISARQKAYEAISARMDTLVTALKDKGIDTTVVEELQKQVNTALQTLKTDAAAYNQTITDLSTMDCTADPAGFKATLETARTQRQKVAKDAAALRTLTGKIVSELAKIKSANNQNSNGGGN